MNNSKGRDYFNERDYDSNKRITALQADGIGSSECPDLAILHFLHIGTRY